MTLALNTRPAAGWSDMARMRGLFVRDAGAELGVELGPFADEVEGCLRRCGSGSGSESLVVNVGRGMLARSLDGG